MSILEEDFVSTVDQGALDRCGGIRWLVQLEPARRTHRKIGFLGRVVLELFLKHCHVLLDDSRQIIKRGTRLFGDCFDLLGLHLDVLASRLLTGSRLFRLAMNPARHTL